MTAAQGKRKRLYPDRMKLEDVYSHFSFSRYVEGKVQTGPNVAMYNLRITQGGNILDPVQVIALALTEECRGLRRGLFYYLPSRHNNMYGHPCDLVFVDTIWSEVDRVVWDGSSHAERLGRLSVDKKLGRDNEVIPICARILDYDEPPRDLLYAKSAAELSHASRSQAAGTTDTTADADVSITSSDPVPFDIAHLNIRFDPAARPDSPAYSRPLESPPCYLIHYSHLGSSAFVCISGASEYADICESFPTPGDRSITYIPDLDVRGMRLSVTDLARTVPTTTEAIAKYGALDIASRSVRQGLFRTNAGVVRKLIEIWAVSTAETLGNERQFGPVKYKWGYLHELMQSKRDVLTRTARTTK